MKACIHSPLFLIAILVFNFLHAADDRIYVDLAQEIPLERIHIVKGSGYLERLSEILTFDFNQNGRTLSESNKTLADYEISLSQEESLLKCKLINLSTGVGKSFDQLGLTMDLSKDRQTVHRLSDAIFKALFQEEGIASTRFLYTRKTSLQKDSIYELIEADYDGANKTVISKQKSVIISPCYFPPSPGKRPGSCLFVSYVTGEPKLFLSALNDFQPKRLSLLKGNQLTPAISRSKDRIAFVSDAKGNPDLYLADFESNGNLATPRRIYGFPKASQASPTFSPDGKKIAFVSNKDGFPRIYSLTVPKIEDKIRNLKPELLTTLSKESTAPSWSPDGKKLVYCARDPDGIRQIYIYDFTSKKEKQLTFGGMHKENPVWGPNSQHLLFNTSSDQEASLYLMNLHQKEPYRLPLDAGENRFPSWG